VTIMWARQVTTVHEASIYGIAIAQGCIAIGVQHRDGALFLASAVHIAGQLVLSSIVWVWGMSPNQTFQDQETHVVHLASKGCITTLFTLTTYLLTSIVDSRLTSNSHIPVTPKCSTRTTHTTRQPTYNTSTQTSELS
jgi:hypothetical protein